MKVIFLTNVAKIGKKDEIKEVNTGYAQNFLFPRKLAVPATESAVSSLKKNQAEKIVEHDVKLSLIKKIFSEINGKTITIKKKANEKGVLFSKIENGEVIDEIKKETKNEITSDMIKIGSPIKQCGVYDINIVFEKEKTTVKVSVEKE